MIMTGRTKTVWVIVSVVAVCLACSSCEPLRKKFTRKKKHPEAEDRGFVPVLSPEDYPAPEENPEGLYRQHYDLLKAWYTDLWSMLRERNAEKRTLYVIKQVTEHIDGMEKIVVPQARANLAKLKGYLDYYRDAMGDPAPQRNVSRIQSDLRAFHRHLVQTLAPGKMSANLLRAK